MGSTANSMTMAPRQRNHSKGRRLPAPRAQACGQPAKLQGLARSRGRAAQNRTVPSAARDTRVFLDVKERRVDVDGQPRHGQQAAIKRVAPKAGRRRYGRQRWSLADLFGGRCWPTGGSARPFHHSFSACQWISASTRRDPMRRAIAHRIAPLPSGLRAPVRVATKPAFSSLGIPAGSRCGYSPWRRSSRHESCSRLPPAENGET